MNPQGPYNPNAPNPYGNPYGGAPNPYGAPPQQGGYAPAASQPRPLDMTSQMLDAEDASLNWEIDANAQLPPILPTEYVFGSVDQGYMCTVAYLDKVQPWKDTETRGANPRKYIYAEIELTIVDCVKNPAMNGRKIIFRASTLSSQRGATAAMKLIQGAGLGTELMNRPRTPRTQVDLIQQIIASGRRVQVVTDWEASFWNKDRGAEDAPRKRGYNYFQKSPQGEPIPECIIQNQFGQTLTTRARNVVVRFIPMTTAQPQAQIQMPQYQQPQTPQPQYQQPQYQQPQQPQQPQYAPQAPQYQQPQQHPVANPPLPGATHPAFNNAPTSFSAPPQQQPQVPQGSQQFAQQPQPQPGYATQQPQAASVPPGFPQPPR